MLTANQSRRYNIYVPLFGISWYRVVAPMFIGEESPNTISSRFAGRIKWYRLIACWSNPRGANRDVIGRKADDPRQHLRSCGGGRPMATLEVKRLNPYRGARPSLPMFIGRSAA